MKKSHLSLLLAASVLALAQTAVAADELDNSDYGLFETSPVLITTENPTTEASTNLVAEEASAVVTPAQPTENTLVAETPATETASTPEASNGYADYLDYLDTTIPEGTGRVRVRFVDTFNQPLSGTTDQGKVIQDYGYLVQKNAPVGTEYDASSAAPAQIYSDKSTFPPAIYNSNSQKTYYRVDTAFETSSMKVSDTGHLLSSAPEKGLVEAGEREIVYVYREDIYSKEVTLVINYKDGNSENILPTENIVVPRISYDDPSKYQSQFPAVKEEIEKDGKTYVLNRVLGPSSYAIPGAKEVFMTYYYKEKETAVTPEPVVPTEPVAPQPVKPTEPVTPTKPNTSKSAETPVAKKPLRLPAGNNGVKTRVPVNKAKAQTTNTGKKPVRLPSGNKSGKVRAPKK